MWLFRWNGLLKSIYSSVQHLEILYKEMKRLQGKVQTLQAQIKGMEELVYNKLDVAVLKTEETSKRVYEIYQIVDGSLENEENVNQGLDFIKFKVKELEQTLGTAAGSISSVEDWSERFSQSEYARDIMAGRLPLSAEIFNPHKVTPKKLDKYYHVMREEIFDGLKSGRLKIKEENEDGQKKTIKNTRTRKRAPKLGSQG